MYCELVNFTVNDYVCEMFDFGIINDHANMSV